jgi:GAF domain-containing protein
MAGRKDLTNQLDGLFSELEPEPKPHGEKDEIPDAIDGLIEGKSDVEPVAAAMVEAAPVEEAGRPPAEELPAEELPAEALSLEASSVDESAVAELAMDELLGAEPEVGEPYVIERAEAELAVLADIVGAEPVLPADEAPVEEPVVVEPVEEELAETESPISGPAVSELAVDELLDAEPGAREPLAAERAEAELAALADIVGAEPVLPAVEAPAEELPAVEPPAEELVEEEPSAAEPVVAELVVDEAPVAELEIEASTAEPAITEAVAADIVGTEPELPAVEAPAEELPAVEPPAEELVEEEPPVAKPVVTGLTVDELPIAELYVEAPAAEEVPAVAAPETTEPVWEEPVVAEAEPTEMAPEVPPPSWEIPTVEAALGDVLSATVAPPEEPDVIEPILGEPVVAEAEPAETVSEVVEPEPDWEMPSVEAALTDILSAAEAPVEPAAVEPAWEEPGVDVEQPAEAAPEAARPPWEMADFEAPVAGGVPVAEPPPEEPVIADVEPTVAAPEAVETPWDLFEFEPAAAESIWEEPAEETVLAEPPVEPAGEEPLVAEAEPPVAVAEPFQPVWEEPTAEPAAAESIWEEPAEETVVTEPPVEPAGEEPIVAEAEPLVAAAEPFQPVWEEPTTEPAAAEAIWETPVVAESEPEEPIWDESVVAELVAEVVEKGKAPVDEAPIDETPGEVLSVADLAITEPELAEAAAAVLPVDLPSVEEPAVAEPPLVEAEVEEAAPSVEEPAAVEPVVAEADAVPVAAPPVDKSTVKLPPLEAPPGEERAAAEPRETRVLGEPPVVESTAPAWDVFLQDERLKILNALLGIVAVASTLLIAGFVVEIIRDSSKLGSHIPYFVAYVILLVVTFFRQIPWKLRAGVPIALFYLVGFFSTLNRGVLGPADLYLVVAPLVVAVLFGHREGAISAVGSAILYGGLALAQNQGLFRPDPDLEYNLTQMGSVLNLSFSFIMLAAVAALMLWRSRSGLIGALREAEERRAEAARSQALLRDHAEELAETNVLLEKRSIHLEAASDLAHSAVADVDLDEWMQQAVDLICQRFNLYHVGLYLLDEDGSRAVMMAGTGDTGRQMLARDFGCDVGGGSAVGRSVAEAWPYIAREASDAVGQPGHDVGSIADFGEIRSLLPSTRCEIALPLQSHGQMLGVLDAHSAVQGVFSEEEIAALRTLADQMAVAIHNAKLFVELRQRLEEMEAAQRLYVREQFADFATRQVAPLHQRTRPGTVPLVDTVPLEVENAMAQGEVVVRPGTGDGTTEAALVAPIQLRGEIIGALGLQETADGRAWTQDEVALVEAVADQMALAIENIRLLDETRQRAQRDRLITDITAQVRASMDVERILQTAVRGLGAALGTSRAYIRLGAPLREDDEGTRPLDAESLPGGSGGNGRRDEEKDQGGEEPSAVSVSPMQDEPVADEASTEAL